VPKLAVRYLSVRVRPPSLSLHLLPPTARQLRVRLSCSIYVSLSRYVPGVAIDLSLILELQGAYLYSLIS